MYKRQQSKTPVTIAKIAKTATSAAVVFGCLLLPRLSFAQRREPIIPEFVSVPPLIESNVTETVELNQSEFLGGPFAPGWAGYIDVNQLERLGDAFHDDGTVDGGLLYDIYNSRGYISEFVKPEYGSGHVPDWTQRSTWVNNVKTVEDFLRYVFGVIDIRYDPGTDEYSLVSDETVAVIRNDAGSHNGLLRRGIIYEFKLGRGEKIRFVRGTTLDLFGGVVFGFDSEDKLRKALASGEFAIYKLTVDGNIVPIDVTWEERPGLVRAENLIVKNTDGEMILFDSERIPLEEGTDRGFMGTVGIGIGMTFKKFLLEGYLSAAVGIRGVEVALPGFRAKARIIGPNLLVLPVGVSPEAIVSYDHSSREWVIEAGTLVNLKSAAVYGEAVIGPVNLGEARITESDKAIKIGLFIPLVDWLDIQGSVEIGGRHLTPEELELRWGSILKLKPTDWGCITVSAQYDPFSRKTMYGIQLGVEVSRMLNIE